MKVNRRVYKQALNRAYLNAQGLVGSEGYRKRLRTYQMILERGIVEGYW